MHPELDNAMKAAFEASRYLVWWCNRPKRALEIMTPFHSFKIPTGAEKDRYDIVMSLIMAVTGDCYLTMKEPIKAAEWHRRASQYYKGGGYPSMYAKVVLQYNLSDHYQAALECMEAKNANWRKQPFLVKLLSHFLSGWWLHPHQWRLLLTERGFSRRLRHRIDVERTS